MVTSASRAALEEARDAGAVEALTHLTRASPSADAKDAAVEALRNFSAPPVRGVTPRAWVVQSHYSSGFFLYIYSLESSSKPGV